jgi:hypothetical protein
LRAARRRSVCFRASSSWRTVMLAMSQFYDCNAITAIILADC